MKNQTSPNYMTAAQKELHSSLLEAFGGASVLSTPDQIRLEVLACVVCEVRALQAYVNAHGTTYEVLGKSGDLYSRARPEHQQLNEARTKAAQLTRQLTSEGESLPASIDELLR